MVELTNESSSSEIVTNSHFYIYPSDNPDATLVPATFDGTGFKSWHRSVLRSLSVKNKLVFINGECKRPATTDPNFRQWVRCDDMVTSWILNSLSKKVADSVEYVSDALDLWTELEGCYDQMNRAKLYETQKEINDLSQGALDITIYYTKMKRLWEELSNLCASSQCNCPCICGAKANMQKAEQDRRLIQFLMDLNELYTTIKGSILMMNTLPSMAQTFALLVQREKQREVKPNNQLFMESSSLMANSSGSLGGRNFRTNYSPSNTSHKGRPFYDYCKRPCHVKDKCYKLHGYPLGYSVPNQQNNYGTNQYQKANLQNQHHRYNNKEKNVAANSVSLSCNEDLNQARGLDSLTNTQGNINLTKEQYGQIAQLLKQFQGTNIMEDHNDMQIINGAVNFAGPFTEEASGDW